MTRSRLLPALAATALLVTATGCVTAYGQPRYGGYYGRDSNVGRAAYDNGYRRGADRGVADARSGRNANYRNDRDYRDADRGYSQRYGPRGQYRQEFRRGYEAGYREGYSRYARGSGDYGYGGGRAVPRDDRSRYPDSRSGYPDARSGYPDSRAGGYRSGYAAPAYAPGVPRGVREGARRWA